MNLPNDDCFNQDMTGANGPVHQLLAFRACWAKASMYVRAINQSAVGCSELCEHEGTKAEVEALSLVSAEIVLWFERIGLELEELGKLTKHSDSKMQQVH